MERHWDLKKTYHSQANRVFQITPDASIGIMDVNKADKRSLVTKTSAVSFIVKNLKDVDKWNQILKKRNVNVTTPPSNGTSTPVRSVQFTDPEGYEMEIFAWLPEKD